MYLNKLRIDDFGCFRNARLENLDENLVVIGGPQRAGKTTFMQTLRQFPDGVDRSNEIPPATDEYRIDAELTHEESLDREWARAVLEKLRVEHETRPWERSPRYYLDPLGNGLHDLLLGDVVPAEDRFAALQERLEAVPEYLAAARDCLEPAEIPPIWIESSLRTTESLRQFMTEGIPEAAAEHPDLSAGVVDASESAAEAVAEFGSYLQDVEGDAAGEFAVGRERFDRLLGNYHKLDMDADDLYEFGLDWIEWYEREMSEIAEEIDPGNDWQSVLDDVKDDYPDPDNLLQGGLYRQTHRQLLAVGLAEPDRQCNRPSMSTTCFSHDLGTNQGSDLYK